MDTFDRTKHLGYFSACLKQLPEPYSKLDSNRLTLVHFAVHALDMLGVWDSDELQEKLQLDKKEIVEWIYTLQVIPCEEQYRNHAGFRGATYLGGSSSDPLDQPWTYNHGHIAMTYTALLTLTALGENIASDDTVIQKDAILDALKCLQLENGSFQCIAVGSENDMRFLYCACSISHILGDWRGVDKGRAVDYIRSCRAYDGAIALIPGQEGHGGSTFCAVASLMLMERIDVIDDEWRKELVHWCVSRQIGGMQGRPNKLEDTCYSYWIGGTLRLLGHDDLLSHDELGDFVMRNQTKMGGFSKQIGAFPDLLHAYYSMSYLSFSQEHFEDSSVSLKALNCTLGVTETTAKRFVPLFP